MNITPATSIHAQGRPDEAGFTLLELVLSMALTAMLLSMLSAGVYSVVNDWQRETSVLDEALDKALVVLQLERALQAAFPHSYVDSERVARTVYFEGTATELNFVSAVSPQRRTGLTAWQLRPGANGLELTLAPALSDHPGERLASHEPVPLLPNYTASFRYLAQLNADTKEWLDEWSGFDMRSLPRAVEVVLTPIDDRQGDAVLEIVAQVRSWRHDDIDPVTPGF